MSARSEKSSNTTNSSVLTRENLAKLKLKALRKGCWFKALKQNERTLLNLTISIVQRVRSFLLAKAVFLLVSKLCAAMESKIYRLMRTKGCLLAGQVSKIAQNWGNKVAKKWANDDCFIQYLTINNIIN